MATNNNNAKLPDEVNYNDAVAASKEYFNGDDLATSAAVYAPYLAIIPTQPLQFPDGGTTVGFSTLYDLKLLNQCLLVAGNVIDTTAKADTVTAVLGGA